MDGNCNISVNNNSLDYILVHTLKYKRSILRENGRIHNLRHSSVHNNYHNCQYQDLLNKLQCINPFGICYVSGYCSLFCECLFDVEYSLYFWVSRCLVKCIWLDKPLDWHFSDLRFHYRVWLFPVELLLFQEGGSGHGAQQNNWGRWEVTGVEQQDLGNQSSIRGFKTSSKSQQAQENHWPPQDKTANGLRFQLPGKALTRTD